MRDKIACSQFIAALTDGFIKRSLQVEGVISPRVAIERAKTLKLINRSSFSGKRDDAGLSSRTKRNPTEEKKTKKGKREQAQKRV